MAVLRDTARALLELAVLAGFVAAVCLVAAGVA